MTEAHNRAKALQEAKADLQAKIECFCRKRHIERNAALGGIMSVVGAVSGQLIQRMRDEVFNAIAANDFPGTYAEFDETIRSYLPPGHRKERLDQLWRVDRAVDRRIEAEAAGGWEGEAKPTKGAGEQYDPDVVVALARAIGNLYGHSGGIARTRDKEDHKVSGPDLDVLVAAYYLASVIAWQSAAPPNVPGPNPPKKEGLLSALSRAGLTDKKPSAIAE